MSEAATDADVMALDLRTAQNRLQKLATYACHYGNCHYDSWNKRMTRCGCGLFQLLTQIGFGDRDADDPNGLPAVPSPVEEKGTETGPSEDSTRG